MPAFLYQCPTTNKKVQGWAAPDTSGSDRQTYVAVDCAACGLVHLVDPATGRTASQRAEG